MLSEVMHWVQAESGERCGPVPELGMLGGKAPPEPELGRATLVVEAEAIVWAPRQEVQGCPGEYICLAEIRSLSGHRSHSY
jgi:hypothetical protein